MLERVFWRRLRPSAIALAPHMLAAFRPRAGDALPLGQLRVTPGAQQPMEEAGDPSESFLRRHVPGDWGDIDADDCATNEAAVQDGSELMSAGLFRRIRPASRSPATECGTPG